MRKFSYGILNLNIPSQVQMSNLRPQQWDGDSRRVTAAIGGQVAVRRHAAHEAASFAQPLEAMRPPHQPTHQPFVIKPTTTAAASGVGDRTQLPAARAAAAACQAPRAVPAAPAAPAPLKHREAGRRVTAPEQHRPLAGGMRSKAGGGGGGGGGAPPVIMAPRQSGPHEDLGVHFEQLELRHRRQHRSEGGAGPALPPSGGPSFALAALAGGRLPSIEVGGVRSSGSSHVITEHEYEGIRLPGAFSASDSLD